MISNETAEEVYSNYYLPIEQNFFAVSTFSLLILTVSLVFFHMTSSTTKSMEMKPFFAKFFSIALITISSIYIAIGLVQYHSRMVQESDDKTLMEREKVYWILYLIMGIFFMALEIFICYVMIQKVSLQKKN